MLKFKKLQKICYINVLRNMQTFAGPVFQSIDKKLRSHLNPSHLEILNESYKHKVPKDSETHFRIVVVSENFKDLSLLKRHQLVYDALKEEMKEGVHALSIVAKTDSQWQQSDKQCGSSPPCMGGENR